MKNFFLYLSGAFYSNRQCMLTWKKPKKYPIIIFLLSFIMLLTPIQNNMLSTPVETIVNQIPNIEKIMKEVAIDLNSKNIDVKIENNQLSYSEEYQNYIDGFQIYIGIDMKEYPEVKNNEISETDNLIVFSKTSFYARYIKRTTLGIQDGDASVLSGYYNMSNSFDFNALYEVADNNDQVYNLVGSLLKTIYLSNWGYNMIIWVFVIEMINLLYLLLGSFLLLLFNKKGNRDYKLTYGQTFLTLMGSLILPTLLASIIGMFNFAYFTLSYVLIALIRLFMLCYTQLSNNTKYNQLEVIEDEGNFKLNFK